MGRYKRTHIKWVMLLLVGFSGFQLIQMDACYSQTTLEKSSSAYILEKVDDKIPTSAAASNPYQREGYAIVCGVSDYPEDDADLEYCDDDATNMYQFLQQEFFIPSDNIIKLVNDAATINNIITSIENISKRMDGNDMLFFSYSGHGSADLNAEIRSWHIESPHPYTENYDNYWSYSAPGAAAMRVHFTRVETESGYDGVFVGDNDVRYEAWDLLSGTYYNVWSNWVLTDDIYVELYTDYSYNYWGFEVDQVEVGYWGAPYFLNPYDGLESGLSGTTLKSALDQVPGSTICVLDSCHSGGVAQDLAGANRLILAASQPDEFSLEDPSIHQGVFTSEFLDIWDHTVDINVDGGISFEEIFTGLQNNTESHSSILGYTHSPTLTDNIAGETMMQPSVAINTVEMLTDELIAIDFSINGLGIGTIHASVYNFQNQQFLSECMLSNLASPYFETSTNWAPQPNFSIAGASVYMSTIYNSNVDVSTGYTEDGGLVLSNTTDFDGDTLSDLEEFELGTNIWEADSDHDGLSDSVEILRGINPLSIDTDADSLPDGWEQEYSLNPLQYDGAKDNDFDGLSNLDEYRYGTNPIKEDTDDDNYSDKEEIEKGTDPLNAWSNPTTRFLLYVVGVSGVVVPSSIVYRKKHPKIRTSAQKTPMYTLGDSKRQNTATYQSSDFFMRESNFTTEKTPSENLKEFDEFLRRILSDSNDER